MADTRHARVAIPAGQWFRPGVAAGVPVWEGLTMSDRGSTPGSADNNMTGKSAELDEADEAALMREIIRKQERHREGGVEPELAEAHGEPEPDA
jgi:hypothetical protein